MKAYRVFFYRNHTRWVENGFLDVFANNQTEAKEIVLDKLYKGKWHPSGYDNFYPFGRKAMRINPDEMCHSIVWKTCQNQGLFGGMCKAVK